MRYNRGMIATTLPLAPELWATLLAHDPALLLEQLAMLRLENAALRAQNAVLQPARPAAVGFPGGGGQSGTPGHRGAIAAP
jgi:hypothetical protein